jgi:hypothetical protein
MVVMSYDRWDWPEEMPAIVRNEKQALRLGKRDACHIKKRIINRQEMRTGPPRDGPAAGQILESPANAKGRR